MHKPLKYFTHSVAAVAALLASSAAASAADQYADVIVVMDESGSMATEQDWISDMIPALENGLLAKGVGSGATPNRYALIGFGSFSDESGRVVSAFTDAASAVTASGNFVTSGDTEDGYQGISYALNNLGFRGGAKVNVILITDEDRDVVNGALSAASIESALERRAALLNVVINNPFSAPGPVAAIGVDADGNAYVADGLGDYTVSAGGVVGNGIGTTEVDYPPVAFSTGAGGAAWNLNLLRAGGLSADSFTKAFVDIKVEEITTQPVPEASTVISVIGLAGLAGFQTWRARRRTA
ncbi:MAG: hypothetical protein JNK85_11880 [Verrucomicrobiales bacterium]|nr:hypothetical protein [Verrucomicrobiales bacterium]